MKRHMNHPDMNHHDMMPSWPAKSGRQPASAFHRNCEGNLFALPEND
jgi:hypothetical protein